MEYVSFVICRIEIGLGLNQVFSSPALSFSIFAVPFLIMACSSLLRWPYFTSSEYSYHSPRLTLKVSCTSSLPAQKNVLIHTGTISADFMTWELPERLFSVKFTTLRLGIGSSPPSQQLAPSGTLTVTVTAATSVLGKKMSHSS